MPGYDYRVNAHGKQWINHYWFLYFLRERRPIYLL